MRSDPAKARAWRQRGAEKYAARRRAAAEAGGTGGPQQQRRKPLGHAKARGEGDPPPTPRKAGSGRRARRNDAGWRAEVLDRYGRSCVACGTRKNVQADHMMPRSQQGASDPRNGLPLCGPFGNGCHDAKTAGTLQIRREWLAAEQIEFLAAAGWVSWDDDGQTRGVGYKHFVPGPSRRVE